MPLPRLATRPAEAQLDDSALQERLIALPKFPFGGELSSQLSPARQLASSDVSVQLAIDATAHILPKPSPASSAQAPGPKALGSALPSSTSSSDSSSSASSSSSSLVEVVHPSVEVYRPAPVVISLLDSSEQSSSFVCELPDLDASNVNKMAAFRTGGSRGWELARIIAVHMAQQRVTVRWYEHQGERRFLCTEPPRQSVVSWDSLLLLGLPSGRLSQRNWELIDHRWCKL